MLKNNLRKAFAAVLSAGIMLSFSACGKESDQKEEVLTYSAFGFYECVAAAKEGTDMTENEFNLLGYDDVTLELEPDGTGSYFTAHTSSPLTWTDGELDFGGESPVTFDKLADRLTLHGETGVDMIFQRLADSRAAVMEDPEDVSDESTESSESMATLWYLDSHLDVIAAYEIEDGIRVVYLVTNDTQDPISPEIEITAFAGTTELAAAERMDTSASNEPEEEISLDPGETTELSVIFERTDPEQEEIELCFFLDGLGQGVAVSLAD